jgi:putative oxidoreductase
MSFLDKLRPAGLLLLRLGLGLIFAYHGYTKLFSHPERAQHFFVNIGLSPMLASVAGIVELFGGGLLIVGLYTRIGALALAMEMAVAIWRAHSGEGILAINEYEYALALAVSAFALATVGAGQASLDYLIFRQKA